MKKNMKKILGVTLRHVWRQPHWQDAADPRASRQQQHRQQESQGQDRQRSPLQPESPSR